MLPSGSKNASMPAAESGQGDPAPFLADASSPPPRATTTAPYVVLHGHFYQPPREDPWLNRIERQPSAAPFHDWNERILAECYRPNAFARILDEQGRVVRIVNNYEFLSFNFGPTLLSWLEEHDVEVYQRILTADRLSAERLEGHGNAIAQVYNHVILPLANERDKYTQIRWGIADFQHRFGRFPEGMWLAETAIDAATVKALVDCGIRFVILAPSQAQRIRPLGQTEWIDVSQGQIDPSRPYRCFTPDRSGYLDIFFFDGPISRDLGFGDIVYSTQSLAERIRLAIRPDRKGEPYLINCATDGETFGHHKRSVERTLAYAFCEEFPRRGWQVGNYGHFLSHHPPTWEVQLKPVTAWSCAHGVGRWSRDCGCGAVPGWHQRWRQPLREALNWLRDQLAEIYETEAKAYLRDPWLARDRYIEVILDRERCEAFLQEHQSHRLTAEDRVQVLRLLEMQRYGQLMFTSCGWFFEELSRPEGVQILRYAARAIELAAAVADVDLEEEFLGRLSKAPSNLDLYRDGKGVYWALVRPALISPQRLVAQHALLSLCNGMPRAPGYMLEPVDQERLAIGGSTLLVGRVKLAFPNTGEEHDLIYALLHLGGWDFQCGVKPFTGRRSYEQLKATLLSGSRSRIQLVLTLQELFGPETFDLNALIEEDRQQMLRWLTQDTLERLAQLYRQTYLENYGVLMAFRADGLPIPEELLAAAQITLNQRLLSSLRAMEVEGGKQDHLLELRAIAREAEQLGCQLRREEAARVLDRLLQRGMWHLAHDFEPESFGEQLHNLEEWLKLADDLRLPINLDRLQELYLLGLERQRELQLHLAEGSASGPTHLREEGQEIPGETLRRLFQLGQRLRVNVNAWLRHLQPHQ
ncbi:glycoside hydrolase [Synechococcus sp. 63AY4M2]|nr:glycoside hydrolase [Synechococcus sp. 63AY4M2]